MDKIKKWGLGYYDDEINTVYHIICIIVLIWVLLQII